MSYNGFYITYSKMKCFEFKIEIAVKLKKIIQELNFMFYLNFQRLDLE